MTYNQPHITADQEDEILTSDDYDYGENRSQYPEESADNQYYGEDEQSEDDSEEGSSDSKLKYGKDGRLRNEKGQLIDNEGRTYDDIIKEMGLSKPDQDGYYCDNEEFYKHTLDYCKRRDEALANGLPKPSIDNYMGEQIVKIATHMSFRPNFLNYSYRQDMINEAIDSCLKYIDSFDPYRSNRIFAYCSQICWSSFIRYIKIEKRQSVIKGKMMLEHNYEDFMELEDPDDQHSISSNMAAAHKFMELAQTEDVKLEKLKQEKDAEKKAALNNTNLSTFFK